MVLLILISLIAIITGRISISNWLRLEGKYARYYGLTLLLFSYPLGILLTVIAVTISSLVLPETTLQNPIFNKVLGVALTFLLAVLIALPFKHSQGESKLSAKSDKSIWYAVLLMLIFFATLFAIAIFIVFDFSVLPKSAPVTNNRNEMSIPLKLQKVEMSLDFFLTFNNKAPEKLSELTSCSKFDEKCQFVLSKEQLLDSWGNPFNLSCQNNERKITCTISSYGADKKEGGVGDDSDIKKVVNATIENANIADSDTSVSESVLTGSKSKQYSGKIINLDLSQIEIRNALNIISENMNIQINLDPNITGKFSLNLIDVPVDEALDIILEKNGLAKVKEGNSIRVFRKKS